MRQEVVGVGDQRVRKLLVDVVHPCAVADLHSDVGAVALRCVGAVRIVCLRREGRVVALLLAVGGLDDHHRLRVLLEQGHEVGSLAAARVHGDAVRGRGVLQHPAVGADVVGILDPDVGEHATGLVEEVPVVVRLLPAGLHHAIRVEEVGVAVDLGEAGRAVALLVEVILLVVNRLPAGHEAAILAEVLYAVGGFMPVVQPVLVRVEFDFVALGEAAARLAVPRNRVGGHGVATTVAELGRGGVFDRLRLRAVALPLDRVKDRVAGVGAQLHADRIGEVAALRVEVHRRVQRLELVLQRAAVRVVREAALQKRHGLGVVSGVCVGVGGVEAELLTLCTIAKQLPVGCCGRRIVGGCVGLLRLSADPAFLRGWHLVPSRQCYSHDGDHCDRDFHEALRIVRACRGISVGGVTDTQHLVDTIEIVERRDGGGVLAFISGGLLGGGGLRVFVSVVSDEIERLVRICIIGISFCVIGIGIIIEISFCVIGIIIDIVIV